MQILPYGAREARCRRARRGDVCLKSSGGALQACRRGDVCLKNSGGMLRALGRGCLKRSGAREACCGDADVEARGGVEV